VPRLEHGVAAKNDGPRQLSRYAFVNFRPRPAPADRDNPAMPEAEPQFVRFDDVQAFELAAGVSGRPLFGAGAMINLIEFEPGAVVPLHSHPHEQLGIVLRGMQALVVDGVPHELGPMEGYVLPGGVEHSAYCGPDGAFVVDIFQPVREDYRDRWLQL
jgi:unsaturated pyranuronate lyase